MGSIPVALGGAVFALVGAGAFWQGYNRFGRTGGVSPGGATPLRDLEPGEWAQVEGTVQREEYVRFGFALLSLPVGLLFIGLGLGGLG